MFNQQLRRLVLAGGVAGMALSAPAESLAITNWFGCGGLFGRPGCYSAYRVNYFGAAYGCNTGCATTCNSCTTCCPTQVCSYVPQTAYQAYAVNVPVTTYRPVTTSDPCTGCTTTCMRAFTSYVQRTQYRPVTTYRLSCSTTTTCSTGACGVAAYSISGLFGNTGCCTTGVAVPATATPTPSLQVTPPTTSGGQEPSNTNIPSTTPEKEASFRVRPVPNRNIGTTPPADAGDNRANDGPQLTDPGDRVAAADPGAWAFSPVTWQPREVAGTATTTVKKVETVQPKNDGGWRASTR